MSRTLARALVCAAALLAGAAPAHAVISAEDLAEIQGAIRERLELLSRDEACGAAQRPARLAFRDVLVMGPDVVQQVAITDRAGGRWLAYFSMQRDADGSWQAGGCRLVEPGRTISA